MLYKDKEIPELYHMKHLHDSNKGTSYETNLLNKTLSKVLFSNSKLRSFIEHIQKMLSLKFDMFNIIKNWKNYIVDKYEYRHKN